MLKELLSFGGVDFRLAKPSSMAQANLVKPLKICCWMFACGYKHNQNLWLLVNLLICGGCQLEPGRVGITLLILPMNEEEAQSLQCAFHWVPKQVGSTKTCPSDRALLEKEA